jgi:hypothetical protein
MGRRKNGTKPPPPPVKRDFDNPFLNSSSVPQSNTNGAHGGGGLELTTIIPRVDDRSTILGGGGARGVQLDGFLDTRNDDGEDSEESPRDDSTTLIKTPKKNKNRKGRTVNLEDEDEDDDRLETITEDGDLLLRSFPCMVIFHSTFCESPACVIEGLIKCPILLLSSILCLAIGVLLMPFKSGSMRLGIALFRESCLFLAASLSLAIPGVLAFTVYRQFDSLNDWDLRPIPTIIGYVDPRRFGAIESGDGMLAQNGIYRGEEEGGGESMDSWLPPPTYPGILLPPQRTSDKLWAASKGIDLKDLPEREHIEVIVFNEMKEKRRVEGRERELEEEGFVVTPSGRRR